MLGKRYTPMLDETGYSETGIASWYGRKFHGLCVKGRFGFDFISSEERLTTPLIRKDGWLQPASWDEAIQLVASKLSPTVP